MKPVSPLTRAYWGRSILLTAVFVALGTYAQNDSSGRPSQSTDLILTNVTVHNKQGGLVADLNKSAFTLYDNKEAQEITYFNSEDQPISLGIVADGVDPLDERQPGRTASMIADALGSFFEKSNKSNEYFLIGFNKGPQLFADWTSDGSAVAGKFLSMKQTGPVNLHDACLFALEKLGTGKSRKKVLLVIPNGGHTPPAYGMNDFKESLKKTDVLVYFAFPPTTDWTRAVASAPGYRDVVGITGGDMLDASVQPSTKLLRLFLEQIAVELRHQYTIGFVPKSPGDGKYHRLTVKVTPSPTAPPELKDLRARSREGYLAVSN
jgi:VWFA-related protein